MSLLPLLLRLQFFSSLGLEFSCTLGSYCQGNVHKIKFCQWCGGPAKHEIPDGEEKIRAICTLCGKIAYQNPKMLF
ncbi:hypothetical protein CRYUN_Cryun09bG0064600 [Craigia yunnanensis]